MKLLFKVRNLLLHLFVFASFVFGISSCASKEEQSTVQSQQATYDYGLTPTDTITIILDTLTSPFPSSVSYVEGDNALYFLNAATYQLNAYNLATGSLAKKITFAKDGPDGITKGIAGSYNQVADSIFLTNGFEIYLFNAANRLLRKYRIVDKNLSYSFQVFFNTKDAPVLIGDTLFCVAYPDLHSLDLKQFEHRASVFALNLKTGEGQCVSFYPAKYLTGLFGNNYTFTSLVPGNNQQKKLVFAYPADEFLHTADKSHKFLSKSKFFDTIEPAARMEDTQESHTAFFVTSPSYGPIYFDKYQQVYYRIAELPRTPEEFAEKKWWKKKSIIILDRELTIIGEVPVENDALNLYHCFSTPEGFCIPLDADEESQKQFVVFKLKKI
jgi:Domain of unknown function (DUF4221)